MGLVFHNKCLFDSHLERLKQKKLNNSKYFSRQLEAMAPKETQELVSFYSRVGPTKMNKIFKNLSVADSM